MGYCFLYKRGGGGGGSNRPVVVKTVLGSVISLTDSTNGRLKGLRIFGKTIQNGTPSPDAPVPLESVGDDGNVTVMAAGKNLFSGWELGGLESTDGQEKDGSTRLRTKYIPVPRNIQNMFISGLYGKLFSFCALYDAEKKYLGRTDANAVNQLPIPIYRYPETAYIRLTTYENASVEGKIADASANVQIELGDAATAYEPYKEPQTLTVSTPNGLPGIPVTSGGNYTDSTGQRWVCDEIDAARGVYVQRVGKVVADGTAGGYNPGDNWWYISHNYTGFDGTERGMCSHLNRVNEQLALKQTGYYFSGTHVLLKIDSLSDATEYRNFLRENPITLLGVLKTPIETPLSAEELAQYAALHTNYPNTTIFNDEGAGMEVKYTSGG